MIYRKTLQDELKKLSEDVVLLLKENKCMIGISESVTGGTISSYLTGVYGCSEVLFVAQIPYSIPGKISLCNMNEQNLYESGTVSKFVIEQMNSSMSNRFFEIMNQNPKVFKNSIPRYFVSVSTCGIAGKPIESKPRGLIYIGIKINKIKQANLGNHKNLKITEISSLIIERLYPEKYNRRLMILKATACVLRLLYILLVR
ncbi:MAG: CinA family protein [Promethearchaeota archaeon]